VAGATTTAMETLSTVFSPATHHRRRPTSLISRVLGSCFLRYARSAKLGEGGVGALDSTFLCCRAGQWMHVLLDGCGRGLVAYPGRAIPILVLDLLPFQISLVLEVVQQACRSKSSVGCCCYTNAVQIARFLCGSTKELLLSFPSCNAGSAWSSSNLKIIMMYENYSNQYCTLLSCNYLCKTNLLKTDMPPKNIWKVGTK
jgi:hypothetical protein